jgi:transcription elongation factor GreA
MKKEAIDLLIQKSPRLKRARAKLESMRPGAYCIHRSWGMGRITGYDERENRLLIDFEGMKEGHAMDPVFCVDKLDVLDDKDILVYARNNPEETERWIKSDPARLIRTILEQAPDQTLSNLDLETILTRLLGTARFKKWWSGARRSLIKDPHIAVPAKKTEPWVLREERITPEQEILEEFYDTKAPKKKIALASRLLELAIKDEDIKEDLPRVFRELTASLAETRQLNAGERLYGIWVRNDLGRNLHENVDTLEPTSGSLIRAHPNLNELAEQIPASHHRRFIDLIERTMGEQWVRFVLDLLKGSSGKFTSECINYLIEKEHAGQLAQTLERWLLEQNLKAPVLTWILRNRSSRRYGPMLAGLMTPRLLNAIFFAIDYEALQNTSSRRIPLAEQVSDDQELISDLLTAASFETAYDLAQTLMLNQGFEDLSKKSLLARFIKLYPGIQSIVGGEAPAAESSEDTLLVSRSSFDTRKKEYEHLISVRIPKNKQDIAEARSHGDLRENAEYKMARQEQDLLLARKAELEADLRRARVTDFSDAPADLIGVGSQVDVRPAGSDHILSYTILGAWDSDPDLHIISYHTPLARALMSHRAGDNVEVEIEGGIQQLQILAVRRWVDTRT